MEGLAAHLALRDIWLARQQEELARSWTSFHAAVEARRLEDAALQAAREEATHFAKEVREGAIRDAAELLAPLQSECDAEEELLRQAKAEREAMEGSLAQKRRELGQLETQLLSAHQAAQVDLEEDRKDFSKRERQLALKEKELHQREEQRLRAEKDLVAQREALEEREGDLAKATVKYDENVAAQKIAYERFERRFAEKKKEADDTLVEREKQFRKSTSQKYRDLAQTQEDRFKVKHAADARRIAELERANSKLEACLKRAKDGRRRAEEARTEAVHNLNSLAKDVEEQVAPAMQRAAEASDSATVARALSKQRERMFEALVASSTQTRRTPMFEAAAMLPCTWSTSTSSSRRSRVPSPSFVS